MKAVAVDSVAACVMDFEPAELPFLALGQKQGFGTFEVGEIWTRGSDLDKATRKFKKPAAWHKPA